MFKNAPYLDHSPILTGSPSSMDRSHFERVLTQVLENYRRCGITRFASLLREECSAEMLSAVIGMSATIDISPVPLDQHAVKSDNSGSEEVVSTSANHHVHSRVGPSSSLATPSPEEPQVFEQNPAKNSLRPSTRDAGQRADELIPRSGLAAEPWSLPVLSPQERQEHFLLLAGQVRDCRQCSAIVSYRQQTVFGSGTLCPRVCFMGEAPGADEDRTGQPFVGKAGQLLTKIIAAMKLSRDDVYILNALKCRPPQNRTPLNEEIDSCRHFVESQLDTLQPEYIVCLGAVAVRSILRSELPIGRLRGKFYDYRGARVVVTYHPSYLLRNESAKRLVWDDMKMLMAELG